MALNTNIVGVLESDLTPPINGVQDIIVKGETRIVVCRLVQNDKGDPLELDDVEEVTFRFRKQDSTSLEVVGSVLVAAAGKVQVELSEEDTLLLMSQTPAPFSIVLDYDPGTVICNLPYQLSVVEPCVEVDAV